MKPNTLANLLSHLMTPVFAITLGTTAIASSVAHAELYDRGNGMIYDSAQNITWLQDFNVTGSANWGVALQWADNLAYGGFSDWRLPASKQVGDRFVLWGYNSTRSELGHLFFELGNKAEYDTSGVLQTGYGLTNVSFNDASGGGIVSFLNMRNGSYWEEEDCLQPGCIAYVFDFFDGRHTSLGTRFDPALITTGVVAVRDGDVLPVPDADGDKVADSKDLCASTAIGVRVDPNGCSINQKDVDADLDGVGDTYDLCLRTLISGYGPTPVDANGCALDQLDTDGDGVSDANDQCPATSSGAVINASGCAIDDLAPCEGLGGTPWANHGEYVSAVRQDVRVFIDLGLISSSDSGAIVSAAAKSSCGQ